MTLPKWATTVTPLSKILALIIFITFPILGFIFGMKYQLFIDLNKIQTNSIIPTIAIKSTITPIIPIDILNLKTYTNKKWGFSISYPNELVLTPIEVDINANYQDYVSKCKIGVYEGCGGSAWPDFKISFLKPNNKSAFDVRIYQWPVSESLGGTENQNFTFIISTFRSFGEEGTIDPVSDGELNKITSTLKFIKQDKPLSCLWSSKNWRFDPIKDKTYIEENKNNLAELIGYFYDKNQQTCQKTIFYTWKSQIENDKTPFNSLSECNLTCVK